MWFPKPVANSLREYAGFTGKHLGRDLPEFMHSNESHWLSGYFSVFLTFLNILFIIYWTPVSALCPDELVQVSIKNEKEGIILMEWLVTVIFPFTLGKPRALTLWFLRSSKVL